MTEGEQFLHKKYSELHTSEPVEHEQARKKSKGEKASQKPANKIADFLEVIKRTHGHHDQPEVLERIKEYYHKEHVIKPEDVPESYFDNQKRIAREQGHGDIEITDEMREQATEVIVSDQESTLDNWVEYFSSKDADVYPIWARYWAFKSMLKLSSFDKEKKEFSKRDKQTVAPFPDLNREALAQVVDIIVKKAKKEKIDLAGNNPELQELINQENFGKLYAYAIEKITPTEVNELEITEGKWIKYKQGSDHMPLVESLQGFGTNWCTAGESTAEAQLKGGDFYVYYSNNKQGKPIIPRVAIRMSGNEIGEVRGIAPNQNLDPYVNDIVKQKLTEFPDGKLYEKKQADMKKLTEIDNKNQQNKPLTKDDLIFLYEIDSPIQGFGYQTDPRIAEIRKTRDPKQDAPIVFECEPNQIAFKQKDINKNTKAYIGPLFENIFQLPIEHIYASFPEGKIRKMETTIGGKTKEQLLKELKEKKINLSDYAKRMMDNKDFTTSKKQEQIDLIRLTVGDLGFPNGATTKEIYEKAEELGLELCPAETGPNLRLNYLDQPMGEWFRIAMKQISDADGYPYVFDLDHDDDGLWLNDIWASPVIRWDSSRKFVFRFRKLKT